MPENYLPKRTIRVELSENVTENSMRPTQQPGTSEHSIDVKTKCQALVLNVPFEKIQKVTVKLISSDLPDRVFYQLSGRQLQMILQERYAPLADSIYQFATIPFALVGNLFLNDDNYLEVNISLHEDYDLKYDRIISAQVAQNPLTAKNYDADLTEFESSHFDEMFFTEDQFADIRFHYNGNLVTLPQILYKNTAAINGFASQKLIPNTTYTLSQAVPFLLVEY